MPKRKRNPYGKRPNARKKRKTSKTTQKVVIVGKRRRRSHIKEPPFAQTGDVVRKIHSSYYTNSLAGDTGGSDFILQGWNCNSSVGSMPWSSSGVQPTGNATSPLGWGDLASDWGLYNVLGCKVQIIWQPIFAYDSITNNPETQRLYYRWVQGSGLTDQSDALFTGYNALNSDPKWKKFDAAPQYFNIDGNEATGAGGYAVKGSTRTLTTYYAPKYRLDKEGLENLMQDFKQSTNTGSSPVAPKDHEKWFLYVKCSTGNGSSTDICHYHIRFNVTWYCRFSDPGHSYQAY